MRLVFIPGDGIGRDVTAEARRVLEAAAGVFGFAVHVDTLPWSADHYLDTGIAIPPDGCATVRSCDAVFCGALGDARVPDNRHAREILLGVREALDLFVTHHPVRCLDDRFVLAKGKSRRDVDLVIFSEARVGPLHVGANSAAGGDEVADKRDEGRASTERHRVVRHAFEYADQHGRSRVCVTTRSNALTPPDARWQRALEDVAAEYPFMEACEVADDALTRCMLRDPAQLDVVVTSEACGAIVAAVGAELQGGSGMAAAACLHPGKASLFMPAHGSAPELAGKNVANPFAACLSLALLLDSLGQRAAARAISDAVESCVSARGCTVDVGGHLGTREATDMLIAQIQAVS